MCVFPPFDTIYIYIYTLSQSLTHTHTHTHTPLESHTHIPSISPLESHTNTLTLCHALSRRAKSFSTRLSAASPSSSPSSPQTLKVAAAPYPTPSSTPSHRDSLPQEACQPFSLRTSPQRGPIRDSAGLRQRRCFTSCTSCWMRAIVRQASRPLLKLPNKPPM